MTESDSDQTGTGWLRRTSKALTNLSPLRPLRGAILVVKVVVEIVDVPGNAVRAPRVTRFATSSGMGSVTKGRDCPFKHVKEPKPRSGTPKNKKGRGKKGRSPSENRKSKEEMAQIPCTYFQQGNCRRGDKCLYKHEKVAAPTKEPKRPNSPAPKKKASAKAAPCITQRYACIAK